MTAVRLAVVAVLLAAVAVLVAACARQEMPPGGPEDRRPPVVIQTSPQPLGTLQDLDGPVRFWFDERISERVSSGTLESVFTVSPRSGEVRVDKGSRSLEVRLEGGFRRGLVYRVTMDAIVSDLFGNQMTDPFELVFTTGDAEPVPTTLAGEVWDRVTGRAVSDAVVVAESGDGLVHQARSGRDGIYAFRYLPGGDFRVTAFEDQNRDGAVDSMEVQGAISVEVALGDTALVDVSILQPDTSSAVLTEAEVLDSITVVATFDDYLDPEADAATFDVTVAVGDTTPAGQDVQAPGVERVFQEAGYNRQVETVADSLARLDSIDTAAARDTIPVPDTGVAPPDTVRLEQPVVGDRTGAEPQVALPGRRPPTELPPLQGERPGPTDDGRRILPGRRVVVVLDEPLEYEVAYTVRVSGVRNIAGLPGGAGEAEFVRERPPPPDTAAADTGAVGDTGAVPDTGGVADTGPAADRGVPANTGTPAPTGPVAPKRRR